MTQGRLAGEMPNSFWMVGSATLAIESSSTSISWAVAITSSAKPSRLPAGLGLALLDGGANATAIDELLVTIGSWRREPKGCIALISVYSYGYANVSSDDRWGGTGTG